MHFPGAVSDTAQPQGTVLLPGQEGAAGDCKAQPGHSATGWEKSPLAWKWPREGELCSGVQGLQSSLLISVWLQGQGIYLKATQAVCTE